MVATAVRAGPRAEQLVQRRGAEAEHELARGLEPGVGRGLVHRLLQPLRRLAGRRGERHERRHPAGLLDQQRQDPRHGRGLARARTARHDREPPPHRGLRRRALAVVRPAHEQPVQAGFEHVGAHRGGPEREQILGDAALLAPVAIQVQRRADEPQRPVREPVLTDRDERARRQPREPVLRRRPGQLGQVDLLVLAVHARRLGDPPQVHEDVPVPRRADRQRRGQRDRLVGLARQRRQPHGHVDVGGGQQPDGVERLQQPVRAHGAAAVERVQLRRAHTPSSSSLSSSSTSAAGARHVKTPHGCPSTTGVSAPIMPRMNRYSTPPRCVAGS